MRKENIEGESGNYLYGGLVSNPGKGSSEGKQMSTFPIYYFRWLTRGLWVFVCLGGLILIVLIYMHIEQSYYLKAQLCMERGRERPFLYVEPIVHVHDDLQHDARPGLGILLHSIGTGPAYVRSIQYSVARSAESSENPTLESLNLESHSERFFGSRNDQNIIKSAFIDETFESTVLPSGESQWLLRMPAEPFHNTTELGNFLENVITVRIGYCSELYNQFEADCTSVCRGSQCPSLPPERESGRGRSSEDFCGRLFPPVHIHPEAQGDIP